MTELMIKMTSWLVASMALGFIVAWLLSRIIYKKRHDYKEDILSAIVLERNNMIDKLEKSFRQSKIMSKRISDEFEDSKNALAEKTSLLTTLQNKFDNLDSKKTESVELKQHNSSLLLEMKELKKIDSKRLSELEGFEEILLLAESRIDENEKSYRQILKKLDDDIEVLSLGNETYKNSKVSYEKRITDLEEELKLYAADSTEAEFIISKDQFMKIEEQLEVYKKEIELLQIEKGELLLKSQKTYKRFHTRDRTLEDKVVNELQKESDESSMVKAFRETYKKITNS